MSSKWILERKQINGQKIKTRTSTLITHVHGNKIATEMLPLCDTKIASEMAEPRQQKTTSHMQENQDEYLEHSENQSKKINKINWKPEDQP